MLPRLTLDLEDLTQIKYGMGALLPQGSASRTSTTLLQAAFFDQWAMENESDDKPEWDDGVGFV